jgi:hypothetical protein
MSIDHKRNVSLDLSDIPALRASGAELLGDYRLVTAQGKTGYHPTSLKSAIKLPIDQHTKDRGSMVLWVLPLEALGGSPYLNHIGDKDPHWQKYGLMGDALPINNVDKTIFAWFWQNRWHSQMIAKFKTGPAAGQAADFSVTPYVAIEHLPLHGRKWYQFTLTWDKPLSRLKLFVNGILCGTTIYPFKAELPGPSLYLGNPAMVFASLDVFDSELSESEVARSYEQASFEKSEEVQEELRSLFTDRPRPDFQWTPSDEWKLRDSRSFTKQDDLAGWEQQGCLEPGFELIEKQITPEGLLLQTPDQIHIESRVYLWSPQSFEGDLAVEFDFRPEQMTGLSLLVVQATGIHREDFLTDHPRRITGAMQTIIADRVRNYHWEFFRRAVDVRGDLGTQIIAKNPWERPLAMVSLAPFVTGQWYKLRFVQEGARLRGSINGQLCFDVTDEAFSNNGPILNSGRIGLRQMYGTRMRYKNLRVWNRSDLITKPA